MTVPTRFHLPCTSLVSDIAVFSITVGDVGLDRFEKICPTNTNLLYQQFTDDDSVDELFVLRTCQRFECYLRGNDLANFLEATIPRLMLRSNDEMIQLRSGMDAIDHVLRVACGLESSIIGEDEILGQLRSAKAHATTVGALNSHLETIVQKAIHVGARTRSETAINEGTVSLGSVALNRIQHHVSDITDAVMIVVGAGKFASLIIEAFRKRESQPKTIFVANRSSEPAEKLASNVDGHVLTLAELPDYLPTADVLVTATTAPSRLLTIGDFEGMELVAVDLGNPRDIDPSTASLDAVELITLEDLFEHQAEGLTRRTAAIPTVEAIIDEECSRLHKQLRTEHVDAVLARIHRRADDIKQTELERAMTRLCAQTDTLSPQQEAILEDFSTALVTKLLHTPSVSLRHAVANGDYDALDHALRLFDTDSTGEIADGNIPDSPSTSENTAEENCTSREVGTGVASTQPT